MVESRKSWLSALSRWSTVVGVVDVVVGKVERKEKKREKSRLVD
jgi:hypothetical protein